MTHKFKILFNEWKVLTRKIELEGNIVQNNIPIKSEDIVEWLKRLTVVVSQLQTLVGEVHDAIMENNASKGNYYVDIGPDDKDDGFVDFDSP